MLAFGLGQCHSSDVYVFDTSAVPSMHLVYAVLQKWWYARKRSDGMSMPKNTDTPLSTNLPKVGRYCQCLLYRLYISLHTVCLLRIRRLSTSPAQFIHCF